MLKTTTVHTRLIYALRLLAAIALIVSVLPLSPTRVGNVNAAASIQTTKTDMLLVDNADIAVTKSDDPDPVQQGSPLTYTVTIANNGPDTAQTVLVTDTMPAGVTFNFATITQGNCAIGFPLLICQIGAMNSGDTVTLTIRMTPNSAGVITNNVVVTTATSDPDTNNNSDSEDTTANALQADIQVTKSDDPDPVQQGSPLTYTVTIANNGPDTAQTVLVTDTMPAGVTFNFATITQGNCAIGFPLLICQIGAMNSGDTVTLTIRMTPNSAGVITNNVVVTTATSDPDTNNNSDSEDTTVNALQADIQVTKSDDPDPVQQGSPLTYTVTIVNNGPDTAANVLVTDTMPNGVTFNFATITQGSCGILFPLLACQVGAMNSGDAVVLTIRMTPNSAGVITNNVVVSTATSDPDTNNNSDSEGTTIVNTGSITITKQANAAGSFNFTGDLGSFNLNNGGSTTFNNVVAGTYNITESDPTPAFNLTNLVCDDANSTVNPGARTASIHLEAGENVTCTFTNTKATPAIALDKQEPVIAVGGGPVTYIYIVTNPGNVPLSNVSVGDTKCNPVAYVSGDDGDNLLEPGETWMFTCIYTPTFTPTFTPTSNLTNSATATGKYNAQTVSATDTVSLYPFTLRKKVFLYWDHAQNTLVYAPGDNTPFTVEVYKNNVLVTTVTISQNSPKRLWLSNGTFEFKEVNLPPGYVTGYYSFIHTTGQGNPDWTYPNVITFDLAIDKTGPTTARKNQTITYYYKVTNSGPASVKPKVTDNKCSPVTYVSGDADNDRRVDPGEVWTFKCNYKVTANPNTSIKNKATVADVQRPSSGWFLGGDRNRSNDSDTWTLQVVP